MTDAWPWLAIAGLGTLHGLSPANGWMFAAAWGVHAGGSVHATRALLPIGLGHAASIAAVAVAFVLGLSMDRALARDLAGVALLGAASYRLLRGASRRAPMRAQAGYAAIALWSFLMATAHGAGLMLLPALGPLCLAGTPAREITASGALVPALAAVGVHTAAMLATTGVIAAGLSRGFAVHARQLPGPALRTHAWTAALALTGALLLALP